jgi:hypothetical protein
MPWWPACRASFYACSFLWFALFFKGFPFLFLPFPSQWHQYPKPYPCRLLHLWSNCFLVVLYGVVCSTTNVQHGLLLVYILGLSPLSNFVEPIWHEIFWHPLQFCCFHFFFFAKGFKQRYSACRCAFKITKCIGSFWYFLSMFCRKAFFFVSLLPFPFMVFKVSSLFLTWPS